MILIAIDGPAASGKSTLARGLASVLRIPAINSGLLYRAITWICLENREGGERSREKLSLDRDLLNRTSIDLLLEGGESIVTIDGMDPGTALRSALVNQWVSKVATERWAREKVTTILRLVAGRTSCIVEGRDIGTAVCPETPYKLFLDAPACIRAGRRKAEGEVDSIIERDRDDRERSFAPLKIAPDACVIEVGELDAQQVLRAAVSALGKRGLQIEELQSHVARLP